MKQKGPVILVVWDGFGVAAKDRGDVTRRARMSVYRALQKTALSTTLHADGHWVGLPEGQPGNSEAGHAVLGAGRIVETDLLRINHAIKDKTFFNNPALLQAAAHSIRHKSTLHLMGLLTNHRSGHASPDHLKALLKFADDLRVPRIALHLFTDGRDTPPFHALTLIQDLERSLPKRAVIASIIGRFYAMDRNRFWERTAKAYHLIVNGEGVEASDPQKAIALSYARGESDEFLLPTVLCRNKTCVAPVRDHDALVFWNLRSDRARQLLKPFVMRDFETREPGAFHRHAVRKDLFVVSLTEFGSTFTGATPAFPHHPVANALPEALRYHHQLYAAESEKFSQVTYFFNGGYDRAMFGEDRLRVPSRRVARYDHAPQMSARELTSRVLGAMDDSYDFVLVNFANADMVGHTGNQEAAIVACETLDESIGRLWKKIRQKNGTLVLTADHGNVEEMLLPSGGPDTEHNANPVPLIVAGEGARGLRLRRGSLQDVAPTVLAMMGENKPKEMKGHSLLYAAS